jgi:hypothetical protein
MKHRFVLFGPTTYAATHAQQRVLGVLAGQASATLVLREGAS